MNWQDIASDAINLVRNAGLKKDVIDLLEKKVALLTDEIVVLTHNLEVSETERTKLQAKAIDLEQQLDRLRPGQGRLGKDLEQFMQFLANYPYRPSIRDTAEGLGIQKVIAEHHADKLLEKGMIERFHGSISL